MTKRKKQAARRKRAAGQAALPTLLKSVCLALPISMGVGMLLALLFCFILMKTGDPGQLDIPVAILSLSLAALAGGAAAALLHRRRAPLLCGSLLGILLFVLLTVAAFILPSEQKSAPALSLLLHLLLIPISMIGAALTAKRKRKRRRH